MMTIDDALTWVDGYTYGVGEDQSIETMARFRLMASEIRTLRQDLVHWRAIAEAPRKRTRKPAMRMRLEP